MKNSVSDQMTKMNRRNLSWWLKQRDNPQLGVYYVKMGQMTVKEAKEYESGTLYGSNTMKRFKTEEEYNAAIAELEKKGERIQ